MARLRKILTVSKAGAQGSRAVLADTPPLECPDTPVETLVEILSTDEPRP